MTSALAAVVVALLASDPTLGPASSQTSGDKNLQYPPEESIEESPKAEDPGDATVRFWRDGLEGRVYYLRSPRPPLLANDAVAIKRARIRYFYPYDDGHTRRRYRVTLWFENVAPAPPETFRLDVEVVETLDELNRWLATEFSPLPLESDFGWSSAIQQMVRTRFIAVGMDTTMVELILGGLEHQVERETLADGRLRVVWLLKNSRSLRRAFSARRSVSESPLPDESGQAPAPGTIDHASGFYLFGGDKPQNLNIVFIDGLVASGEPEPADLPARP